MSALKNLPHRQWAVLRDLWIDHLPDIDFRAQMPEPTLWHLPELKDRLKSAQPGTDLPYVEGARESVFREAVILTRKFAYSRAAAREAGQSGFSTWSVVSGYDACFYGAKALCYLLGMASLDRDSPLFIDLFAPRTHKIGKGRKAQVYDILVAHRLEARLTHKTLWDLTGRLCRTLTLPDDADALTSELRGLSFAGMSNLRNNILYDGGFWLDTDDMAHCDLVHTLSNFRLFSAMEAPPEEPNRSEWYFAVAQTLNSALVYLLGDLARLAPAIRPEVAALTDWRERKMQ